MGAAIYAEEVVRTFMQDPAQFVRARTRHECPLCGSIDFFLTVHGRREARCPSCAALERHRILALQLNTLGFDPANQTLLHFSAERPFFSQWKSLPGYVAGDIKKNKQANEFVDITNILYPDEHFDWIICNHVLEHVVDDMAGIRECYRVLKKSGIGFISVPLSGEEKTFEPPEDMPKSEVERICGWDHKRYYGYDFTDKLSAVGFSVQKVNYTEEQAARYKLSTGGIDVVYMCTKPEL